MMVHVPSYCAFELRDTFGIRIVDEQSATALCDGQVTGLSLNHIQIVKPANRDDLIYSLFQRKFATRPMKATGSEFEQIAIKSDQAVDVGCGKTKDEVILVAIPRDLTEGEEVIDATVALRRGHNLKEEDAEGVDVSQSSAKVHYKLVGLDPDSTGKCSQDGSGMLEVTFEINRPLGR